MSNRRTAISKKTRSIYEQFLGVGGGEGRQ